MPFTGLSRRVGVAMALAVLLVGGVAPATAQDAPVLSVTTSAVYRVDAVEARVDVEFTYEFDNTTASTSFPGFFESIPERAIEVAATDGIGDLDPAPLDGVTDGFETWLVPFRSPLDPGESVTLTVRWSFERGAALVAEQGALAFDVYVPGPDGAEWSPPTIEVPDGFDAVVAVVPDAPYELVRAEFVDLDAFTVSTTDLPPALTVLDWDESGEWAREVLDRAEAVVSSLDGWFGPRTTPLEIRRSFTSEGHQPYRRGVVELAESDAESIDHQLAHAWLADVQVDEQWFVEGLAAAFAGDQPEPGGAAEIVPVVVNEIGAAGVREIVDALRADTVTYPGVVEETQPLPPDWRTVLDLIEEVAGAEGAVELFRSSVIDPADAPLLDARAAARVDYDALTIRAGGWTLPPYLRLAMAEWDFAAFAAEQAEVSDVIVRRDALAGWAESLDLSPREDAKVAFESAATDMVEVEVLLDEQEEALEAFDEAERLVNGDRGLLAGVGLLGHDPDGDLDALRVAWAEGDYSKVVHDGHDLAELVEGAVGVGTIRLLVPALAALALWQFWRMARRRFGARRAEAEAPAQP